MTNPYETPQSKVDSPEWVAQTELNIEAAAAAVEQFFLSERYRLEDGHTRDAVYGIGNNVLRILFGSLVRRYRFKVRVIPSGSGSNVFVSKGMSGAMGGAIGYVNMKNELARIREGVQNSLR